MSLIINPYALAAGAALTLVSSTSNSGVGTSATLTASDREVGDVLLVALDVHNAGLITPDPDWDEVPGGGSGFYYRIATDDPDDAFSATIPNSGWYASMAVLRGGGATVSGDGSPNGQTTTSPNTFNVTGVTMPAAGFLVLPVAGLLISGSGIDIQTPSGFDLLFTVTATVSGFPSMHRWFSKSVASGATGTTSVTTTHSGGGNSDVMAKHVGVSA